MTGNYSEPVSKLLTLGRPEPAGSWLEYRTLGLTEQEIPELIRLLQDDEPRTMVSRDKKDLPEWYAQIHAWRALGQLHAVEAVPALFGILPQIDDEMDDWLSSDAPEVFGLLEEPAIEPLAAYLADEDNPVYARSTASSSLARIAALHPELRERCIQPIATVLEKYEENDEALNGFLIADLVNSKAVEQIDLIKRAYEAEAVDEMVNGDIEDVQVDLGLLKERLTPARPHGLFPMNGEQEELFSPTPKPGLAQKKEKNKRKQEKKSRKRNRKKK